METNELIEHLRIMGKSDDRNPNYYLLAADRLEDLQESVDTWMATFDMLNDRENRHHYLDYWREKNGESNLTYPDGDEVYKDFFAMKAKVEQYESVVGKLAVRDDGVVVGITVGTEVEYIQKNIAECFRNLAIKKAKTDVAQEIFEDIWDILAVHAYTSKSEDYADGAADTLEWVDSKIDELEEKYIPTEITNKGEEQ
jgi:hypothetical protein